MSALSIPPTRRTPPAGWAAPPRQDGPSAPPEPPSAAGGLCLRPGPAGPDGAPRITGGRPSLVDRLAPGRPADAWPALMGALFSLCAPAHRLCAGLAVAAAQGTHRPVDGATRQALQAATAREQALRLAHDWPRLLPAPAGTGTGSPIGPAAAGPALAASLQADGLWRAGRPPAALLDDLPAWLQRHWLAGDTPADWLRAWHDDPAGHPLRWAERAARGPAHAAPGAAAARHWPRCCGSSCPPRSACPSAGCRWTCWTSPR